MSTIIFTQKNRYISWTGKLDDRPILKNQDGMSRRYPKWIRQQIQKIATHIITNPSVGAIPIINQAFDDLLCRFSKRYAIYSTTR